MTATETDTFRKQGGLAQLIYGIHSLADSSDALTVHDIRDEIGERSFGPFLIIPAIIEISPIGGIPGLPTVIAVVICIFAIQIRCGRKHLWLPQAVERRTVDGRRLSAGLAKIEPLSRWIDKVVRSRLEWATKPPYLQGIAFLVIALCATVPPLELIPFASTVPMGAIVFLGLALLARDGLLACIAGVMSIATAYLVYTAMVA